jgi:hypothetical protein
MQSAAVFQALAPIDEPREEWERLPWLFDEPKRVRRRLSGWVLVFLIVFTGLDAIGSYEAGRMSVREGWFVADDFSPRDAAILLPRMSTRETRTLARELSSQRIRGWYRRRPNAPS